MVTLNFETIIPASPIIKVNSYIIIPIFAYSGIIWAGASEVITQYNYSASKNFVLKRLPAKPLNPDFCPVIRYRIGMVSFRYKLWNMVGEGLPEELYAGQVIKKNFVIEIWNTQNFATVTNAAAININLSIRSFPSDLNNIVDPLDASSTEVPFSQQILIGQAAQTPAAFISQAALRFWFKADTGVVYNGAGKVTSWADNSGNARTLVPAGALATLSVSTAGNQFIPMVRTNLEAFSFVGSAFTCSEIHLIARMNNWTLNQIIAGVQNGGNRVEFRQVTSSSKVTGVSPGGAMVENDAGINIVHLFFTIGGAVGLKEFAINNLEGVASHYVTAGNEAAFSATTINLGGAALDMDVAEFFGYSDSITAAERRNLDAYISQRYQGALILNAAPTGNVAWLDNN